MGGSSFRVLELARPFLSILPEVDSPDRPVPFRQRALYTSVALFVFLVCSQLPLYGIQTNTGSDPLHWARVIMASNRGTCMELGISPIVTSGMVIQLLVGSKILDIDKQVKSDRELLDGVEKLVGILITLGEAITYVLSGMYGHISTIGTLKAFVIVLQLFLAGILIIVLDELLSNGYGLGSGISLFIATNICENIIWKAFSPYTITDTLGIQFEGAFIALVHLLLTQEDKFKALKVAFYRERLPNITNLLSTIVIFLIVIYLQGFRVDLQLRDKRTRGQTRTFPIKLFYTSNMPIILQSALVSNLYFISQMLYKRYAGNIFVEMFGRWKKNEYGQMAPIGGLMYYISAPPNFMHAFSEPLHMLLYIVFTLSVCAFFSATWIEISGQTSNDVAKSLKAQQLFLQGHRDTVQGLKKELDKYIPTAAAFGGICVGALTIYADMMGAIGSGTGILLAVTIIYSYFEQYDKEQERDESRMF